MGSWEAGRHPPDNPLPPVERAGLSQESVATRPQGSSRCARQPPPRGAINEIGFPRSPARPRTFQNLPTNSVLQFAPILSWVGLTLLLTSPAPLERGPSRHPHSPAAGARQEQLRPPSAWPCSARGAEPARPPRGGSRLGPAARVDAAAASGSGSGCVQGADNNESRELSGFLDAQSREPPVGALPSCPQRPELRKADDRRVPQETPRWAPSLPLPGRGPCSSPRRPS